jgi:hypothetical protein
MTDKARRLIRVVDSERSVVFTATAVPITEIGEPLADSRQLQGGFLDASANHLISFANRVPAQNLPGLRAVKVRTLRP